MRILILLLFFITSTIPLFSQEKCQTMEDVIRKTLTSLEKNDRNMYLEMVHPSLIKEVLYDLSSEIDTNNSNYLFQRFFIRHFDELQANLSITPIIELEYLSHEILAEETLKPAIFHYSLRVKFKLNNMEKTLYMSTTDFKGCYYLFEPLESTLEFAETNLYDSTGSYNNYTYSLVGYISAEFTMMQLESIENPIELSFGRKKDWTYYIDDTLNLVMGFPAEPKTTFSKLTKFNNTTEIELTTYSITDTTHHLNFSVSIGVIDTSEWTKLEIIHLIKERDKYEISFIDKNYYYGELISQIIFFNSNNEGSRCHVLFKNGSTYIIQVSGHLENIYSDWSHYFFGSIFYDIDEFKGIKENKENYTLDMVGCVLDESKDTISSYDIVIASNGDTTRTAISANNKFTVSLKLGQRYFFGFDKSGYKRKHLIVDVVESGTLNDSKYGFEFPMTIILVKGSNKKPSKEVAIIRYDPFKGYMDY